ncbi:MAG: hypothetical protein MJB57_04180 [Gemmatimonadetes bacterium]|nr:hypothetical protein [Gemmatimonadota bacterium]
MRSEEDRFDHRAQRERDARRAIWGGLVASVGLHLGAVWIAGRVQVEATALSAPPTETVPAPDGLVVVQIPSTPLEDEPEEPRPEPPPEEVVEAEPEPRELEVVALAPRDDEGGLPNAPGVGDPNAPAEPGEEERISNASRLRIRFSDRRLWFDPQDPLLFGERLARFARADSAVRAILRDWLDSLSLTAEQERRARDWTFERDGKRWGISDQGIHLGDITIPIPFDFGQTGPRRREFEQAIRDLTEIQRQDLQADIEAVLQERREAMRQRSEEEARRRRGQDTVRARGPP